MQWRGCKSANSQHLPHPSYLHHMPRRKLLVPYRSGYKAEGVYPPNGCRLLPSHGSSPRCRVDYSPDDDGPWATLQILNVGEGDETEQYACAIPRYYAIPLILLNKRLAFFEAQCRPDGTPLPLADGSCSLKQHNVREYAYLWRLRSRFLKAVFDMNHERGLDDRWRFENFHGYLHRMYRRYGHDSCQRLAYWRDEIREGRVPYTRPDIAEMGTCVLTFSLFPLPSPPLVPSFLSLPYPVLPMECSPRPDFLFHPSETSIIPFVRRCDARPTDAGAGAFFFSNISTYIFILKFFTTLIPLNVLHVLHHGWFPR